MRPTARGLDARRDARRRAVGRRLRMEHDVPRAAVQARRRRATPGAQVGPQSHPEPAATWRILPRHFAVTGPLPAFTPFMSRAHCYLTPVGGFHPALDSFYYFRCPRPVDILPRVAS